MPLLTFTEKFHQIPLILLGIKQQTTRYINPNSKKKQVYDSGLPLYMYCNNPRNGGYKFLTTHCTSTKEISFQDLVKCSEKTAILDGFPTRDEYIGAIIGMHNRKEPFLEDLRFLLIKFKIDFKNLSAANYLGYDNFLNYSYNWTRDEKFNSFYTISDAINNNKLIWKFTNKSLKDAGITAASIKDNLDYLIDWHRQRRGFL